MEQKIEENIAKLPDLSEVVFKLFKIKKRDSFEINELITILEENNLVVAKIMKIANSKFFGFSHSVDTLHNAVSLYGINFTFSIAICEIINNTLNSNLNLYPITKKNYFYLDDQSLKLMLLWLQDDDIYLKEELLIPCLINRIGMFLLSDLIKIEEQNKFLSEIKKNPLKVSEIEYKYTGYSSSKITAMVLKKWSFDQKIINIIENIDKPNSKQSAILNVLNKIFNPVSPFNEDSILEGLKLANLYNLNINSLKKAIEEFFILTKND